MLWMLVVVKWYVRCVYVHFFDQYEHISFFEITWQSIPEHICAVYDFPV